MKRRTILAACAALWTLRFAPRPSRAAQGVAAHGEAADGFLRSLTKRAFAQVGGPEIGQAEKESNFLALFREAFDLQAIGKFVLAKHWRPATQVQRDTFMATFEETQLWRFLPLFAGYSAEMIAVGRVRKDANNPAIFLVSSVIQRPEAESISVVWRIVDRGDAFKVVDIVAEGVSMAISLRHEYGAVARRHGIDGLIDRMREKNRELEAR